MSARIPSTHRTAGDLVAIGLFVAAIVLPVGGRFLDSDADRSTLVLVSLDGFRWDYLDRYETANLDRLARDGIRARSLVPAFPSKTLPSHYTIVTGLYAQRHGMVGNSFYDPELGEWFRLSDSESMQDGRWFGGEPIWVTLERQGVTTATMFWPG